jgi:hypothetical protein
VVGDSASDTATGCATLKWVEIVTVLLPSFQRARTVTCSSGWKGLLGRKLAPVAEA